MSSYIYSSNTGCFLFSDSFAPHRPISSTTVATSSEVRTLEIQVLPQTEPGSSLYSRLLWNTICIYYSSLPFLPARTYFLMAAIKPYCQELEICSFTLLKGQGMPARAGAHEEAPAASQRHTFSWQDQGRQSQHLWLEGRGSSRESSLHDSFSPHFHHRPSPPAQPPHLLPRTRCLQRARGTEVSEVRGEALTAATASLLLGFQAPEGKRLVKFNHVYTRKARGCLCFRQDILCFFITSWKLDGFTEAVRASLLMLCTGDKKRDKASRGQRHTPCCWREAVSMSTGSYFRSTPGEATQISLKFRALCCLCSKRKLGTLHVLREGELYSLHPIWN